MQLTHQGEGWALLFCCNEDQRVRQVISQRCMLCRTSRDQILHSLFVSLVSHHGEHLEQITSQHCNLLVIRMNSAKFTCKYEQCIMHHDTQVCINSLQ